jgi:hypothetical protein
MKTLRCLGVSLFFVLGAFSAMAQADSPTGEKVWYSFYVSKKINNRWSVDNMSLLGMRSYKHDFWFFENSIGADFKINRLLSISGGYAIYMYKYSTWWDSHYSQKPSSLNTINFHSAFFSIQRNLEIGKNLVLSNELTAQYFIPKFEKYQTRFHYNIKLKYNGRNLPLRMKPFVEGAIYYYLNGVAINYYDQSYNVTSSASPNGLHRFRGKLGFNFSPLSTNNKLSFTLYYGVNREFNIKGLGNEINVEHPSATTGKILTKYPFNNYNILSLQLNYRF